jgi:hypothetical protein
MKGTERATKKWSIRATRTVENRPAEIFIVVVKKER